MGRRKANKADPVAIEVEPVAIIVAMEEDPVEISVAMEEEPVEISHEPTVHLSDAPIDPSMEDIEHSTFLDQAEQELMVLIDHYGLSRRHMSIRRYTHSLLLYYMDYANPMIRVFDATPTRGQELLIYDSQCRVWIREQNLPILLSLST